MCGIIMLGAPMQEVDIQYYLINYDKIEVVVDGQNVDINEVELNNALTFMLQASHQIPALGVSVDSEVQKAVNNGIWLKFIYNKPNYVEEMPFDELLIQVEPSFSGFNIIRGNNGFYEGRCYYVDLLGNTMAGIYNTIIN